MRYHRVFGLTARILVDAARVAYGEEPEFECNLGMEGEEDGIRRLVERGRLRGERRAGDEFSPGESAVADANAKGNGNGNGKGSKM